MSARIDRADTLAEELTAAGIPATAHARDLAGRLPGLLIGPPRLAFNVGTGATATWRLLAVADTTDERTAWTQLDQLVGQVAALLPVETADPAAYAADGGDARPAYALTFTEYVD